MTMTTGRAAGQAAGDVGTLDLNEIRFHWGSAYEIDRDSGMWTARRRDSQGGVFADPSPNGLLLLIRADFAAMPGPKARRDRSRASGPGRGQRRRGGRGGAPTAVGGRASRGGDIVAIRGPLAGSRPAGLLLGEGTRTTLGARDVSDLMDQLDAIYPNGGGTAGPRYGRYGGRAIPPLGPPRPGRARLGQERRRVHPGPCQPPRHGSSSFPVTFCVDTG